MRLWQPSSGLLPGHLPVVRKSLRPSRVRLIAQSTYLRSDASSSRRRAVTITNDTGRVPWRDLSLGEKTARTTQQTFNVGIVLVGLGATVAVAAVLWLEVFSTDSKTAVFNRAADRVRKDAKCLELLAGEGLHNKREITAYGEPSWSRWARNRTIASSVETDRAGMEHMRMHFYVEGPVAKGTVNLHMTKKVGDKEFEYRFLALDVPGNQRHYLENADGHSLDLRSQGKMFGVRWS